MIPTDDLFRNEMYAANVLVRKCSCGGEYLRSEYKPHLMNGEHNENIGQ